VQIMLGMRPNELPTHSQVSEIQLHSITIPGLDSQRHLLIANRS
jgi:hypothetical protein